MKTIKRRRNISEKRESGSNSFRVEYKDRDSFDILNITVTRVKTNEIKVYEIKSKHLPKIDSIHFFFSVVDDRMEITWDSNVSGKVIELLNYSKDKEISIFFDTNILEGRIAESEKRKHGDLFLSEIKTRTEFHNIKKLVFEMGLNESVLFCIPEISFRECKEHLIANYLKYREILDSDISAYRKSFGSMLKIQYNFTKSNIEEYKDHIEFICNEFIDIHNCKIIPYPQKIKSFEELVNKAIKKIPPFTEASRNKKTYTDAGFKDALIVETIIQHHNQTKNMCVFVTEDKDFENIFQEYPYINVCKDNNNVQEIITKHFKIKDEKLIKQKIENDPYLKESLLRETGNVYDEESVLNFEIKTITQDNEDLSVYNLDIICAVNEVKYKITCNYDSNVNAFLDVTYETSND